MQPEIYIGTYKLDLFNDESISVKSAIADISDITKLKTDFSRTFTVPASKNNNKLFKHYYNANVDNTFDARKKVEGRIELGGLPFKFGKWTLQKVAVKNGLPSSYTINFTGNLIDLEKTFGKDELKDIDLSEYNHEYSSENVILKGFNTVGTQLFNGDIKYTALAPKQYYYNSDSSDTTNTDELVNIASNGVNDVRGIVYTDLKPSIRQGALLSKIESQYNIEFTKDFFDGSRFSNLYMYCAKDSEPIKTERKLINFDSGSTRFCDFGTDTFSVYAEQPNFYMSLVLRITPRAGYEDVEYSYYVEREGDVVKTVSNVSDVNAVNYAIGYMSEVEQFKFYVEAYENFEYDVDVTFIENKGFNVSSYYGSGGGDNITVTINIQENLPELEIFEYFKAIFKAFKLVAIPLEDGRIYVETLNNYYRLGKFIDVTKYIDFDNYDVSRGELLNEINFKFEDPNTILNQQFKENTYLGYGDEKVTLTDEFGELLDGSTLDIELPFENMVYERLTDQNTNELTGIQYGALIDLDRKASVPKVLLHYIEDVNIVDTPVKVVQENNLVGEILSMNTPANTVNLTDTSQQPFAFLFGAENSTYTYSLLTNNLYSEYHKQYIEGIFNIKRRNFIFNANLPQSIISKINLNDILLIDKNYYRIDNYEIDITTGKTKLKLFNAYDVGIIGVADSSVTISEDSSRVFYPEQRQSTVVVDLGYGTDWITITELENQLQFDLDYNNTGAQRFARVDITSITNKLTTVNIIQDKNKITIDNNTITIDSNLITIDG